MKKSRIDPWIASVWDPGLVPVPVIQQDIRPPDEGVWESDRVHAGIIAGVPLQIVVAPVLQDTDMKLNY